MQCSSCGKSYTTLPCPDCHNPVDLGRCPDCLGDGAVVSCPTCGHRLALRWVPNPSAARPPAAAQSPGRAPASSAAAPAAGQAAAPNDLFAYAPQISQPAQGAAPPAAESKPAQPAAKPQPAQRAATGTRSAAGRPAPRRRPAPIPGTLYLFVLLNLLPVAVPILGFVPIEGLPFTQNPLFFPGILIVGAVLVVPRLIMMVLLLLHKPAFKVLYYVQTLLDAVLWALFLFIAEDTLRGLMPNILGTQHTPLSTVMYYAIFLVPFAAYKILWLVYLARSKKAEAAFPVQGRAAAAKQRAADEEEDAPPPTRQAPPRRTGARTAYKRRR